MPTFHVVHVSDSAFMHLSLAGLESYLIEEQSLETYGLLWGNVSDTEVDGDLYRDYRIDHVTVDIGAERYEDETQPNDRGFEIKQATVNAFWPHLTFLGDFHTHPYAHYRRDRVVRDRKYTFSEGDRTDVEDRAEYWQSVGLQIGLVLTIAGMDHPGWRRPRRMSDHAIEWTMDLYRFWLAAYAVQELDDLPTLFLSPREDHWEEPEWADDIPDDEHQVKLHIPPVLGLHQHDRMDV